MLVMTAGALRSVQSLMASREYLPSLSKFTLGEDKLNLCGNIRIFFDS